MNFDGLFQNLQSLIGPWGGDLFNVYRPNYTLIDNTPQLIYASQPYRIDPVGTKNAEPGFPNSSYYAVFGNREQLLPGDILIKSTPDGMTAPVTILTNFPLKDMTAMRTGKVGNIVEESGGATIYNNVYFNLLGISFPGIPLNRAMEDTLRIPNVLASMFNRANLVQTRCHLIENDFTAMIPNDNGELIPFQKRWLIEIIDFNGNEMILTLKNI